VAIFSKGVGIWKKWWLLSN